MLRDKIETRLRALLEQKEAENEVSIEQLEIMPDHGPLFVKPGPGAAPHWIVLL